MNITKDAWPPWCTRCFLSCKKKEKSSLFKSAISKILLDGDQCRDFIYVKDVARITCDFLENELSGIFNVGSGEAATWNALAPLSSMPSTNPFRSSRSMPEALSGQYQNYTRADMANIEKRRS